MNSDLLLALLHQEIKPALGCTEPGAVALASAFATHYLGGRIENIEVRVSPNVFKNAMRVMVPKTNERGLSIAAALGAVTANPEKGLELLENVTPERFEQARQLVANNHVTIQIVKTSELLIIVKVSGDNGWSEVQFVGDHTDINRAVVNGKEIISHDKVSSQKNNLDITSLEIKDFVNFIEEVPMSCIMFLAEGIDINLRISRKGLELKSGLGLGAGFKSLLNKGLLGQDLVNKARIAVAAACDARMAGEDLPVMSAMGSGNQGIGASVPVIIAAEEMQIPRERLIRALALSYLITGYVKQHTGKLSPVCGCSIAAGVGAAASITWMFGGDITQIGGAVKNMIGNLAGMICDGAKGGCALKLSTSAGEAIISALLARQGVIIESKDGIVSSTVEKTIRNLCELSGAGMANTDNTILKVMFEESKVG